MSALQLRLWWNFKPHWCQAGFFHAFKSIKKKRQTSVHWKVLWEVLRLESELAKTLEKGNFCHRRGSVQQTEDTIYNAQAQATPLNKNKAPLLALLVPCIHTNNALLFTAPIVSSSFFTRSPVNVNNKTKAPRHRYNVQGSCDKEKWSRSKNMC